MEVRESADWRCRWPDEVELWLLFRCKNSQEWPRATVCRASEIKAWNVWIKSAHDD
jgi:hypothetical protein